MLSLPDKPWRRVRIVAAGQDRYHLTFLAGVNDRDDFEQVVADDLASSLGRGDRITDADWESRSVVVVTSDRDALVRSLALHRLMVERES